jgi:C1A family cysteine protease
VKFAGYSDGSYGAAAARWVSGLKNGHGGILYRQKYGDVDLTTYSIPRSKDWGAYGVPANLAAEANKHTARAVALCETWEGLTAALESGMCVPVCSNVGFAATSVRDADGFLPRGGSWGHCMCVIAVKYAKNNPDMKKPRDGVLIINSWGPSWCSGPKHPLDQPDGSFWITKDDALAILKQGDSFVIGSVDGFKYRDLNNGGWLAPVPVESLTEVTE